MKRKDLEALAFLSEVRLLVVGYFQACFSLSRYEKQALLSKCVNNFRIILPFSEERRRKIRISLFQVLKSRDILCLSLVLSFLANAAV